MKKLLLCLILMLFPFSISYVDADTVGVTMSGPNNIDAGASFDVVLSMTGTDILGAQMDFIYDADKLELLPCVEKSGFAATVGTRIILDSNQSHNGSFEVVVLRFKAKSSFVAGQDTTIKVSNVLATNSNYDDITGNGTSKTVTVNIPKSSDNKLTNLQINGTTINGFNSNTTEYTYNTDESSINVSASLSDSKAKLSGVGVKNLDYGNNTIVVTVTAENGTIKNYKINVLRNDNRSSDNYLSSLEVKGADIKFNKNTLNYSVNVENNVSSVEIVATANDSKAKVSGIGKKNLDVYANSFTVTVTAENGKNRNYVIKINRKDEHGNLGELSKNNKLRELVIEGYDIGFNKDTNNYQLEVDNIVEVVNVKAVVDDEKASMTIDNPSKLKVGNNQIKVKVVSEFGEENIYIVSIVRKDNVPVTNIESALEVLDKMTISKLDVEIKDDNNIINKDLSNKLKDKKVEVNIKKYIDNKLVYNWKMNSKEFVNDFVFNSEVKFISDKKDVIDKLTNYTDVFYMNFSHSGKLPRGTSVTVYVGNKYINDDKVNLYYYNEEENKIELVTKDLVVNEGGYVTFDIRHCSSYVLSKAILMENDKTGISFITIISIIEGIVIVGLLIFIFCKSRGSKTPKVISQQNDSDLVVDKEGSSNDNRIISEAIDLFPKIDNNKDVNNMF